MLNWYKESCTISQQFAYQSINVDKTLSSDRKFDWIKSVITSYLFTRQILTLRLKHHRQLSTKIAAAKNWFPLKSCCRIPNTSCCIFLFFALTKSCTTNMHRFNINTKGYRSIENILETYWKNGLYCSIFDDGVDTKSYYNHRNSHPF